LGTKIEEAENWLSEAPDETTKSAFVEKLTALQKFGDPIERRYKDFTQNLPDALKDLQTTMDQARALLASQDQKYEHIAATDRAKVTTEIESTENWVKQQTSSLHAADKTQTPPVAHSEVLRKKDALHKLAHDTMNKPKPAPPKEEKKDKKEEKKEDKKEEKKGDKKADTETPSSTTEPKPAAANGPKADSEAKKSHMDGMDIDV